MTTIQSLRLDGLLSFAPGSRAFGLGALNVLIGANGSGKSNVVEALELLRSTPGDFAQAIRDGGGPREWLWKGEPPSRRAELDVVLEAETPTRQPLRYRIEFTAVQNRVEVLDEAIENTEPAPGETDVHFHYRFQRGRPAINVRELETYAAVDAPAAGPRLLARRHLRRETLPADQSVLAQFRDADLYPEVTWLGRRFAGMQTFREWTFGRHAPLRRPRPADLPEDRLLPDAKNLALVLNQIQHRDGRRFDDLLKRFFPRFERMTTLVSGGTVQFYLHETDFSSPVPPTRLSDGTIRFVALLATLLSPSPPPLVCIEEPELGLHPDAVALLAELLAEASERMQIVVTTHSDALVSALTGQPDAVVACERPGAGTELRRIDPGQLADWLERYQLGDLWRMGELGANP